MWFERSSPARNERAKTETSGESLARGAGGAGVCQKFGTGNNATLRPYNGLVGLGL